jgi:inner membrane protein
MDPVTHFLTGACIGRAGLNRKTAYATLAATLAAEAPDIDVVASIRGPVTGFAHHRGITHTLVGAPFMALAVTLIVYGMARLGRRREPPLVPARWGWVYLAALVADFSHLALDLTNNYGLRPFYPFNPRWYSLDLVFIIDPLILLFLGLGLGLPAIFGLVDREITRRRSPFPGRGLAIAALVSVALLWALRNAEHAHALSLARQSTLDGGALSGEPLLRAGAEPYPLDPFHWHIIAETQYRYKTADVHTLTDNIEQDADPVPKPSVTPSVAAAKQSYLGRVYLDWSSWPLTVDLGALPIPGAESDLPQPGRHTVRFTDMRFAYSRLGLGSDDAPVLAGWVYVDPSGSIETEVMNGRVQH